MSQDFQFEEKREFPVSPEPIEWGGRNGESESLKERRKTPLRMGYEAQAEVSRRQIGDLKLLPSRLGLSSRKICQLLCVDPSAWSRWTRPGATAPPHIYRSLQWYLMLEEKWPGLTPNLFLGGTREPLRQEIEEKLNQQTQKFSQREQDFQKLLEDQRWELQKLETRLTRWMIWGGISLALLVFAAVFLALALKI